MKEAILGVFVKLIPNGIKYRINKPLAAENRKLARALEQKSRSYSQEGEDLVVSRIFENKKNGVYVDVGAFDPIRYSNTYRFYELGWRGINIDARPGSMVAFREKRPGDTNIEVAVGTADAFELEYFLFEDGAYNTTNPDVARKLIDQKLSVFRDRVKVKVRPLSKILDEHLHKGVEIDFMSVDVEGVDLDVLKSNNWEKYRPKLLLVESYGKTIIEDMSSDICTFLNGKGYYIVAKTVNTLFLMRKD